MAAKIELDRWDGKGDFGLWKRRMYAILVQQKVAKALSGEIKLPDSLTEDQKADMMDLAFSSLTLHLDDKVLREVASEKSAAGIWSKLEHLYMTKSLQDRIYLKGKFFGFKMTESRTIGQNLDEFNRVILDLENIGIEIDDEDKAIIILNALPKSHSVFVETMKYARETLSFDDVQKALKSKEIDSKQSKDLAPNTGDSLLARGRSERRDPKHKFRNRSKSKDKKGKCFHCHKVGHYRRECPERHRHFDKPKDQGDLSMAEGECSDAEVLCVTNLKDNTCWVLDSGCSFHMSPNKCWFETFEDIDGGQVVLGNNKACQVRGIGSIRFKMHDGTEKLINNIRYVPELKRNLISLGVLDQLGYTFKANNGNLTVSKGALILMRGVRSNGLYVLSAKTIVGSLDISEAQNLSQPNIWHLRLAHISEKGLYELNKQGLLKSLQHTSVGLCEDCLRGKATRVRFQKGLHVSKEPLDYVHSDLWGPSSITSNGGARYFMTLIDDFSRRVWIYTLKHKSEALQRFKQWVTLNENQYDRKVKKFRTDNGLEFCSKDFDEFCRNHGIVRHLTVAGTPQQNGVAERMNRTILERVRCMLSHSGLNKTYWAEAATTACYLINRSPSVPIDFLTPMEKWSGRAPNLENLKVFGCTAFAHVKQGKLESRAVRCLFLGYPDGVKGYKLRCLEPGMERTMISRDVTFKENEFPMKNSQPDPLHHQDAVTSSESSVEVELPILSSEQNDMIAHDVTQESDDVHDIQNEQSYHLARDRQRRTIKPPVKYGYADLVSYAFSVASEINEDEPLNYKEAINSRCKDLWQQAMQEEINSLHSNNTWELVAKPHNKKIVGSRWIFKKKDCIPGVEQSQYKARLVAKGYSQIEGIDYHEIFSPVVKYKSIRAVLSIVAHYNLELEQLDVKTAFLHDDLEEVIYMIQPEGFEAKGNQHMVCLLKKSLYGLKQAPRQWYKKFDDFMSNHEFKRSNHDWCVYTKLTGNHGMIYLLLYVDDMLIACQDMSEINKLKAELKDHFKMKDLGAARKILGMEIIRHREKSQILLSQKGYLKKVLARFGMLECKPVQGPLACHLKLSSSQSPQTTEEQVHMNSIPYASGVGSLMYAMVCTRPDLAYAVSMVSRFIANPGKDHWQALKWIFRYLKGSLDVGLNFQSRENESDMLVGYVDSDFAGNIDTRKSLTGYVFISFGTGNLW